MKDKMTYADSGVDIHGEGKAIRGLLDTIHYRRKGDGEQVDLGGNFTGLVDIGDRYLSMCTDGVGSKIKIAELLHKWDTIGIDCMAMNVNDMICIGAEPVAFVDYIAAEDPDPDILREIGKGLNEGARQSNLTVIGGETATLPDIVKGLDLAGTCLGMVKKERIVKGDRISSGDLLVALPSSGIHSNGYTLVRDVINENDISYISPLQEIVGTKKWKSRTRYQDHMKEVEEWIENSDPLVLGEELLKPTRIYVKEALSLLNNSPPGTVKGMANITGGGLRNISRMDPSFRYVIDDPLEVPPIFRFIQVLGGIEENEMYQTFNMGMGMVFVLEKGSDMDLVGTHMKDARVVGRVEEGSGVSLIKENIEFDGYV